ncbi:excalibur calcium-binding domain-containing protein [Nocardia goodfellowii]|nr:excalibur calcium-binding domain-containing protein [Nocardia goodfellowii]
MQAVVILLGLLWLAIVLIAIVGLLRGSLDWAGLRNRKQAGWLLAASFVVLALIVVIAPDQRSGDGPAPSATASPATESKTTAAPTTTTPTTATTETTTSTTTTTVEPLRRAPFAPAPPPLPAPPPAPELETSSVPKSETSPTSESETSPAPESNTSPVPPSSPGVYYRNCTAARAAGAAPLFLGEPGYRSELDRDNDGIAGEV